MTTFNKHNINICIIHSNFITLLWYEFVNWFYLNKTSLSLEYSTLSGNDLLSNNNEVFHRLIINPQTIPYEWIEANFKHGFIMGTVTNIIISS